MRLPKEWTKNPYESKYNAVMSRKYNRALKRSEWVASGWNEIAFHCQEQNKIWGFRDMIISCKARRVTVCQRTSKKHYKWLLRTDAEPKETISALSCESGS
ncbi:hypothetical protein GRJ2_001143300 [Grus japonensis]|uniref:Uncharacterized protein n=1 Tax=Grus japonensis TaxID=30415 RepID=A0ABC9WNL8_GRUJA